MYSLINNPATGDTLTNNMWIVGGVLAAMVVVVIIVLAVSKKKGD